MAIPTMIDPREPTEDAVSGLVPLAQPAPSQIALGQQGWIMTAQPVAKRRSVIEFRQEMRKMCAVYGESYVYSWEVNDRRAGKKTRIEGPSIDLAMDMARMWGNCLNGVARVEDAGDSWVFHAFFIDLETGFNTIRPFRQRKSQSIGMGGRESDREVDIVFQIGASKAIRNVTVNALKGEAQYCVEESKRALAKWIESNFDKAIAYIDRHLADLSLDVRRVEAAIGRDRKQWTNQDMARVIAGFRAISDGMATVDETYPPIEVAVAQAATRTAETEKVKAEGVAKAEAKTAAATASAPPQPATTESQPAGSAPSGAATAAAGPPTTPAAAPSSTAEEPDLTLPEGLKRGRGRPRKNETSDAGATAAPAPAPAPAREEPPPVDPSNFDFG